MTVTDTAQINEVVHGESIDGIGVLTIDNPPVNASSAAVRSGLLEGLATYTNDDSIRAIVLVGAEKNFISGSDLNEFSQDVIPTPELPQVIEHIRNSPKPVIAAISGATLGGGLELALGCDYRIALTDTIVGLPETTLGMIPGAGGTQRPLRLLGPDTTMQLVTSGRRAPITDPAVRALVDEVVSEDLKAAAVAFAQDADTKRDLLQEPVLDTEPGVLEATAAKAIAVAKGRPQIVAAVGAILAGIALPATTAMMHERNEFTRLRNGEESQSLRHIFFAERKAAKSNRPAEPVTLNTVAIIGAGTMGRGIAQAFADNGIQVMIHDQQQESLDLAQEHITGSYQGLVSKQKISRAEADSRIQRVSYVPTLEELRGADLFIEAVFEDLAVKTEVLQNLEGIAEDSPIATNTSYLNIELLADEMADPARFLGLHFFSPAHRTPLVEVVYGRRTGQAALDMAFTASKAIKKVAICSAVGEGFIGNRIFNAYRRQSELLLEEGALPAQIDAAMRQFGFAMGPFEVADMSGLDIAWRMRQRTAVDRDPAARYPDVADTLCELGRFGQKTGAGWYRYGEDGRTPIEDPEVTEIIEASSQRKGITRRTFRSEQIAERMVLAMANEAALVLEDGIADRASDIDVMMVRAYGFPSFRGGPSQWVKYQDPMHLQQAVQQLQQDTGTGFQIGNLELLTAQ